MTQKENISPRDMGTTGLIDFVLSDFRRTWQRYQKALAIVRKRHPHGWQRFPLAVVAKVRSGVFSRQYVTRVLRYVNGGEQ